MRHDLARDQLYLARLITHFETAKGGPARVAEEELHFDTPEARLHHLIVDRCYVHGDAKLGARRGVALNCRNIAVIDSYIADFKEVGADSQAVSGWNGPGGWRRAGRTSIRPRPGAPVAGTTG